MANEANKKIATKVIKEEYPGISQSGIDSILANIEIETGFNKFVEIPQDYDAVMANSDLVSMQGNLNSLTGGKAEYDALSDREKLGVLYQGDKDAKYAGGIGGLQLTSANYGGLGGFEAELDTIAGTLNMSSEDLYDKAKTDPETAIRLSIVHLRDIKGVNTQELNVSNGESLRKDYINPHETQGVATSAQQSRTAIFQSYSPQVAGTSTAGSTPPEEGSDYEGPFVEPDTNTRGVPTEAEAKKNPDYAEDKSESRASRTSDIEDFRSLFMELDKQNPKGKGSAQDELNFKMKVSKLIKDHPASIYFSDNFDGYKEELLINEKFLSGESTNVFEKISSTMSRNYTELSDKIYNDSYYNETVLSRVKEVDEYEYEKPEVKVKGTTASGAKIVELPSGRTTTIEADEPITSGTTLDTRLSEEEQAEADRFADIKANMLTQEEKDASLAKHEDRAATALLDYPTIEENEAAAAAEAAAALEESSATSELKDKRSRQMAMAEKALTGLKAAAGLTSLSKALQEPDIKTPQVSNLVKEALGKQKQLSTMGLNAAEKASAMQGINEAYSGAIKNILGASGGQRGSFLANQGVADANRVKGLLQLSAQDAAVRRQNVGQYNQLASSVGQMQLSADMSAEQMKQQAIAQNKQMLGGIGSNLLSDAISDATYYLNPNREHMDEMMKQYMESTTGNNGYTPPTDPDKIGMNDPSMTDKERKAEAARVALEKKNNALT